MVRQDTMKCIRYPQFIKKGKPIYCAIHRSAEFNPQCPDNIYIRLSLGPSLQSLTFCIGNYEYKKTTVKYTYAYVIRTRVIYNFIISASRKTLM